MLRRTILLSLVTAALALSNAFGQDKKSPANADNAEKGKYQNVQVAPFTTQEGVQMTAEQLKSLHDAVVKELQETKKFKQVLREGETPADAAAPTLQITGTVVKFKAGSRAKRYFVGFGAGKSKLNVKFLDGETGRLLYEHTADGDVFMGVFGGGSGGAKSELAEDIAKFAKKMFF